MSLILKMVRNGKIKKYKKFASPSSNIKKKVIKYKKKKKIKN